MPYRVYCPDVLDDKEGNPLPLADVPDVDASADHARGIDDEKRDIEFVFVPWGFLVVRNV